MMMKNKPKPSIVALGGGTGLSTLLRGLKTYTSNLTAIVNVTDDGGSSGTLRRELGVLPPGDIRNCLVALSGEENLMARLFQYRFPSAGSLSGHSFGNLFLTAMSALTGGFDAGIARAGEVLAINGRVMPVTLRSVTLRARLTNGSVVRGESMISKSASKIEELSIYPYAPPAAPRVLDAISSADAIILGPGSLYTSIIANLLVEGVCETLLTSKAPKIYICNIMTQPGETSGYTLADHVDALVRHGGKGIVDYVIANTGRISVGLSKRYARNDSFPVTFGSALPGGVKAIKADLVADDEFARHDPAKLGRVIYRVITQQKKPIH